MEPGGLIKCASPLRAIERRCGDDGVEGADGKSRWNGPAGSRLVSHTLLFLKTWYSPAMNSLM